MAHKCVLVLAITIIITVCVSAFNYKSDLLEKPSSYNYFKDLYNPPNEEALYLTRHEINQFVSNSKDIEKIIEFYTLFTKDARISRQIITDALYFKMPINLAFALCWNESRFYPKAYNSNKNGTIDRGLFQLNNSGRQNWKIIDFYDIEKNCHEGIQFWSEHCMTKADTIEISFVAYNMGPYSDGVKRGYVPEHRETYINDILTYEDKLNVEFNKFIRGENVLYRK